MRIVHLYRDLLGSGGVPHLTRKLVESQASLGHDILVVSAASVNPKEYVDAMGVEYVHVTTPPRALRELRGRLVEFGPDIVHVAGLTIASQQLWAQVSLEHTVPYVISPHGVLNPLGMAVRFGEKRNTP